MKRCEVNTLRRLIPVFLLLISFGVDAACITELTATTSAAQTGPFLVDGSRPVTLIAFAAAGLSAVEHGDVQITHDGGTTWQDLFASDTQIRLNSTNNAVTIYGPGTFRVDKDVTTNATAILRCLRGAL